MKHTILSPLCLKIIWHGKPVYNKVISKGFVLGWGRFVFRILWWSFNFLWLAAYYFLLVLSWWQTRVSRVLSPIGKGGVAMICWDDLVVIKRECANKFCPLFCCRPSEAGWASRHQAAGAKEEDHSDAHWKSLGRQILLH
jgi:hypothetical protein